MKSLLSYMLYAYDRRVSDNQYQWLWYSPVINIFVINNNLASTYGENINYSIDRLLNINSMKVYWGNSILYEEILYCNIRKWSIIGYENSSDFTSSYTTENSRCVVSRFLDDINSRRYHRIHQTNHMNHTVNKMSKIFFFDFYFFYTHNIRSASS